MTIEPVKSYKAPTYPTIEQYVYNPQELLRNAPHSWLGNAAVMTALLAFTVGGTNCVYGQIIKPNTEQTDKKPNKRDQIQQEQQPISHVAPVFVHGDGRGVFGCVVVAPPVILSEDDALQIIKAELAKHNLILDSTDQSIQIPVNKIEWKNDTIPDIIKEKNLKFDGEIKNISFLIEYLSRNDCNSFEDDDFEIDENGEIYVSWSSVIDVDTKQMANSIREKIIKDNKLNAIVFYDPMVRFDKRKLDKSIKGEEIDWNSYRNMTEEEQRNIWEKQSEIHYQQTKPIRMEAHKLLIQQVDDFVNWLKQEKLFTE
jgi:hypothetical protein